MPAKEMAWPIQQSDRQWVKPEGDDPRTLYQMLMVSQKMFGNEPCFGFIPSPGMARIHLTYNEFGDLSTAMAKGLRDIGVEKGDRVAIILDNSVEWAALSYGANAIGAAYTAMYTHQHGKDWAYILEDSTPKVVAMFPFGSRSMRSTRRFAIPSSSLPTESAAARLTAVVVFPQPPL